MVEKLNLGQEGGEKEEASNILKNLINKPGVKKLVLAGLLALGVGATEIKAQDFNKDLKNSKENIKSLRHNSFFEDIVRSWIHFVKTKEVVENEGGYNPIDALDKTYIHKKGEEENYKKFMQKTSDVSDKEMEKVFEYLEHKMDPHNFSKLVELEGKMKYAANALGSEPLEKKKIIPVEIGGREISELWNPEVTGKHKEIQEKFGQDAINMALEIKKIIEQK